MGLRICLPRVRGRGHGLGNELIPWARAHLAAEELGARLVAPAFGRNRRRYGRHFGTPWYDFLRNRALPLLAPTIVFDEAAWRRHGAGDVRAAVRGFAVEAGLERRRSWVLVTEGMWGGYRPLESARGFVRDTLMQSRYAPRNLARLRARLDPQRLTAAFHVRRGDFSAPTDPARYRGRWTTALPLEWYRDIARALREALGDAVQFLIVSDGAPAELAPLLDAVPCVTTFDIPDSECSDLLALADADLLVCSLSSFSQWAAFLSNAPYLWFAPALTPLDGGFASMWGDTAAVDVIRRGFAGIGGATGSRVSPRGLPVGADGRLPVGLVERLLARRAMGGEEDRGPWQTDLVRGGVVPL